MRSRERLSIHHFYVNDHSVTRFFLLYFGELKPNDQTSWDFRFHLWLLYSAHSGHWGSSQVELLNPPSTKQHFSIYHKTTRAFLWQKQKRRTMQNSCSTAHPHGFSSDTESLLSCKWNLVFSLMTANKNRLSVADTCSVWAANSLSFCGTAASCKHMPEEKLPIHTFPLFKKVKASGCFRHGGIICHRCFLFKKKKRNELPWVLF